MTFDELYNVSLLEANSIYPIYEYIDNSMSVLTEDPDDIYRSDGSSTFLWLGNFIMYEKDKPDVMSYSTHNSLLYRVYCITQDSKYELPSWIHIIGDIPHELESEPLNRDSFLRETNGILGRYVNNSNNSVMSFWNSESTFDRKNKQIAINFIKNIMGADPEIFEYQILGTPDSRYDTQYLTYEEFLDLNASEPADYSDFDTSHIIHTVDPAKKGDILKARGIKPKLPKGVEARFLRGESTTHYNR